MRDWMKLGMCMLGLVAGCAESHTIDGDAGSAGDAAPLCRTTDPTPLGLEPCTNCGHDDTLAQVCVDGAWACPGTSVLVSHCSIDIVYDAGPPEMPDSGSFTCPDDPSTLIGQSCNAQDATCGTCTDPCGGGICNLVECQGGAWQHAWFGCPAIGFPCGPTSYCDRESQYCQHVLSDVSGEPDTWNCQSFPVDCPSTCDCFAGAPASGSCATDGGDVTVTFGGG